MWTLPTDTWSDMLGGMKERFRAGDYVRITVLGFGISALWSSLHTVLLQVRLLDFVAESQKNTYLGLLTFTGLVLAMLVQPVAGALSDRSAFAWGRRRPFVLLGMLLTVCLLFGIGLATSYLALFVVYCLMQVSSNTAQGPFQGLIPDLVPPERRGSASGVKSLLEILGGAALLYPVALLLDRYARGGSPWLWLALGLLAAILLGLTLFTVLSVSEQAAVATTVPRANPFGSFRINLRQERPFAWFLLSRFLVFMGFTALQTFALYFLRDVTGIENPAGATAQFSIVAAAAMVLTALPAGRLSDRVGRRPIIVTSGVVGAAAIGLVFLFRQNYPLILACAGLIGISFGAFLGTDWALATDLVAGSEAARYLGLANLANAGGAAAARLIGPAIDFFNARGAGLGYSVMLFACFALFLSGALLVLKVRPQPG